MTCMAPDCEQGFVELVERMRPRLKRILASFRVPACDAEDLLQEAFLALVRSWGRIECPEAWLGQTLYRICCTYLTRRRNGRLQYLDGGSLEGYAPVQRPAQERAELYCDLKRLARLLPRRYQLLLELRYGLGMSSDEIAAQLGYRSSSVRKLSIRALTRLRIAVRGRELGAPPLHTSVIGGD
jgi:RNA polymerase sigma factor (sigma-70 family)